jgi:hypothetical protein
VSTAASWRKYERERKSKPRWYLHQQSTINSLKLMWNRIELAIASRIRNRCPSFALKLSHSLMRILHAADIHLDSPLVGLAAKAGDRADELIGATRRAFTRLTTDDRTVLRADKNLESFLSDLKESMPIERAAQHIGLTRGRFMSLVDANIIKPLVPSNGDLKSLSFLKADLDDLLERLRARTIPRTDSDRDFMPLIFAAQAANRPLSEVVQAVLDGRVTRVVDDFDRLRFNSVCIAKDEICRLLHVGEKQGLSLREAARNLTTTVSVILALREIGMLEIVKAANPINRYPQNIVSVESVAAFGKTYVNLFQLARDWGQHHLIVLDKLTKAGIRPAFDRGEIGSRFFERSKLPPL